jgi:hypothetical protein
MMEFDGSKGIIWSMWMVLSHCKGLGLEQESATFAQLPSPKSSSAQAIS